MLPVYHHHDFTLQQVQATHTFSQLMGLKSIWQSLLIASIALSHNLTSHLEKTPYFWFPSAPRKPPDGYITASLTGALVIAFGSFHFCKLLLRLYRVLQCNQTKLQRKLPCHHLPTRIQHSLECFVSDIQLPAVLFDAFAGQLKRTADMTHFDTDSTTFIMDNSANCHICHERSLFIGEIKPLPNNNHHLHVRTASGSTAPKGYGTVQIHIRDDNGHKHRISLHDTFYFPDSPVNILGVTAYAKQLDDDEGTYILTKAKHSVFVWDHSKHCRTFHHPPHSLPELTVNEGFLQSTSFYSALLSVIGQVHRPYVCFQTEQDAIEDAILPEESVKDGKGYRVGSKVICVHEGSQHLGTITNQQSGSNGTWKYQVQHSENGTRVWVNPDQIRMPDMPDIGIIPTTQTQLHQEIALQTGTVKGGEENHMLSSILSVNPLTPLEMEFMHWHHKFAHLPTKYMLRLARFGMLPKRFLSIKRVPKCPSCQFSTAHKRSWRHKGSEVRTIRKESEMLPGDAVSTDQIVSAQEGLVPQVSGTLTSDRIVGATVFVDHATDFVYVHLMRSLTSEATIEAKMALDKVYAGFGHTIKRFRADNGRYADAAFMENLATSNQSISFCGVGAHHQNAIAERAIKELTLSARTLLIHAQRHWPEYISTMLWPFALKAAAYQINHLRINSNGLSPMARMLNLQDPQDCVIEESIFHTFGCPVYVLDSKAQSGRIGPPKWNPHGHLGIYVGHSPLHAGSVAMVLNPSTGHVSPQFHVVFDDDFKTVPFLRSGIEPPMWKQLVKDKSEMVTEEAYNLASMWLTGAQHESSSDESIAVTPKRSNVTLDIATERGRPNTTIKESSVQISKEVQNHNNMPPMINLHETGLRKSTRMHKPPDRLNLFTKICMVTSICIGLHSSYIPTSFTTKAMNHLERINKIFDGTINETHPLALATSLSDNETYTFREMLQQPDREQFMEAMIKEIRTHEENDHWEVVTRKSIGNSKTILAIWSFKRKRHPDGSLDKHKARLCAHGGMQQWGVNYWETYAPVVNWISVRLLLSISLMYDLPTTAIDFVLAYPQATLPENERIYMEIPAGTEFEGVSRATHVLRLKKNLYGLKQAGLNWFNHLKQGLEDRGFQQSEVDPCVFLRKDAILIAYVDDCIIMSQKRETIKKIIKSLQDGKDPDNPQVTYKAKYVLTDDGEIKNYLGVQVLRNRDGSIELKQKFLIERIIDAVGLDKSLIGSAKPVPAIKPLLSKDLDGPPRKCDWNYRSVVGMCGYLQSSTRPDISMAVHQCARFNNEPRMMHERALRRIAKYLIGTQDRGIIFKPDKSKGIECFADASFADGWAHSDSNDPENVLSRTGYVIYYAGCPIHWVSKLQTEHALSTCEAEYVALSQSMRDVIPMMNLITEFKTILELPDPLPKVHCKVFEDNSSCIKVAKAPSMTPRTKHIALKYHHFRSFIRNGSIEIIHIGTSEQIADILTKPLTGEVFKYLRKKLMGW